jgi:NAD(P)H dehydrogenase (quinone)
MAKVYIIYHSKYGHTKLQAEAVLRGAGSVPAVDAKIFTTEQATAQLDAFDAADAIVFGSPTYMGSMSADVKLFLEVAAKKWFTLAWKDKIAGAFTNSSGFSGDKLNTLIGLVINAMQHGMIYVGTGMMPSANDPNGPKTVQGPGPGTLNRLSSFVGPMAASFEVSAPNAPPPGDLLTAEAYGKRVAEITLQFLRGKSA